MTNSSDGNAGPLHYMDATALAALIKTKNVSSREVVQAHLSRITDVNPRVNAIVTLMETSALEAADRADAMVANGSELGPLHGVPFSIKDSIDMAGVLTQTGSKLLSDNMPGQDATSVARFRQAGGIPLAKTNVPEFCAWWETDNLVTGLTRNPWNLERTAGGSSGGESGAVSSGMTPIGIGSDVGISIRGPAALTGIVGLKATHGRIPYTGHWPTALKGTWHIGPMARSVRDIATAFSVLKGADGIDGYAIHAKTAEPADAPLAGKAIRVGWITDEGFGPVDPEVSAAVEGAAKLLRDLGCEVEQVRLPILENTDWVEPASVIWSAELLPYLRPLVAGREADLSPIGALFMTFPEPSLVDYVAAEARVETLKSAFAGYFQNYDVLLCPVIPFTAREPGMQEYVINGKTVASTHAMRATVPFNLTGLPALSVPFRFSSERLPINVQLVSRWLDEETILRLGLVIEAASELKNKHPSL